MTEHMKDVVGDLKDSAGKALAVLRGAIRLWRDGDCMKEATGALLEETAARLEYVESELADLLAAEREVNP